MKKICYKNKISYSEKGQLATGVTLWLQNKEDHPDRLKYERDDIAK